LRERETERQRDREEEIEMIEEVREGDSNLVLGKALPLSLSLSLTLSLTLSRSLSLPNSHSTHLSAIDNRRVFYPLCQPDAQ
jgi:hypothetical protein